MQQAPRGTIFQFPSRSTRSCVVIKTRVMELERLWHMMIAMGIGHGSIHRVSAERVDVMIVLPSDPRINLNVIAEYFGVRWNVCKKTILLSETTFLKLVI